MREKSFGIPGEIRKMDVFENKMAAMNLDFNSLLKQALAEWPQEFDLSTLQQCAPDLNSYSVKGLGKIFDEIERKYIGTDEEIIWRDLHSSIYELLHTIARSVYNVKCCAIRSQAVRLIFERRLKKAAANPNLNWRPEDFALVETYFAKNSIAK